MNIWLDDIRQAPEGWVHVHSLDELRGLIEKLAETFEIDAMSFDYNLGDANRGIDVMKFLADLCAKEKTRRFWPKEIRYHSNDPRGLEEMRAFAEKFEDKANWIFAKMFFFKKRRMARPRTKRSRKNYLKYKHEARRLAEERANHLCEMYGFEFNRISIRNQRTIWGSCSKKGNLNFNYRILFLPLYISDYIIAHEICHLKELNHSRKFWNLVGEIIPDYPSIKKELMRINFSRTREKVVFE